MSNFRYFNFLNFMLRNVNILHLPNLIVPNFQMNLFLVKARFLIALARHCINVKNLFLLQFTNFPWEIGVQQLKFRFSLKNCFVLKQKWLKAKRTIVLVWMNLFVLLNCVNWNICLYGLCLMHHVFVVYTSHLGLCH